MTTTEPPEGAGPVENADPVESARVGRPPGGAPVLSATTRSVLIVHAALLAAQPFLAGAMLDAMSAMPQTMHNMVAMTIVAVGLVQIGLTWWAWKGKASWPREALVGSLMLWGLELGQFTLGHLTMAMAMHIPLGITVLALGVYLAVKFTREPSVDLPAS